MFRRGARGSRQCRACSNHRIQLTKLAKAEHYRAYRERYYAEHRTAAFEERTCKACGKTFWFYKSLANSGDHSGEFCSRPCLVKRVDISCACCRRTFQVWPCMVGKRKYCSRICAGTRRTPESITEEFLRRQHYQSPEWRALSAQIIERDGCACQKCSATADLVVHHKVSWIVSRDDSPDNLITLCRTCHADEHRDSMGRLGRILQVAV